MSPGPVSSEAAITVSPSAHVIRYTLDSTEVTTQLPSEARRQAEPRAEKLVASLPLPSDIFR